jgi:putative addiction module killer protein
MNTLIRTAQFSAWLKGLKDSKGVASILARIDRAQKGNFGDSKSLKGGLSEMRVDVGPGYRVYSHIVGKLCMCFWPAATRDRGIAISHKRGK